MYGWNNVASKERLTVSRINKLLGDFFDTDIIVGDIINIKTWMPGRASLTNYVVVGKPSGTGYEGFIIRKTREFGGTTATMYIPWNTITKLEVVGHEEL